MRIALLLVIVLLGNGCTLLAAGVAADLNRQRRAEAVFPGDSLVVQPFTLGERLGLRLEDGTLHSGTLAALATDSLPLRTAAGEERFAIGDIQRVRRPWSRASIPGYAVAGVLLDAVIWHFLVIPSTRVDRSGAFDFW